MLEILGFITGYKAKSSQSNRVQVSHRPNIVNDESFYSAIQNSRKDEMSGKVIFDAAKISRYLSIHCSLSAQEEKVNGTIILDRESTAKITWDIFAKNFLYFAQEYYSPKKMEHAQKEIVAQGELNTGIFGAFLLKFASDANADINMLYLFSSKLVAEFWNILAEQKQGITAVEARQYVKKMCKLMDDAMSEQYDSSKFFQSALSLVIDLYIKHKVIDSIYETKYSFFAHLIENSPIEKILDNLNAVIYLHDSNCKPDPNVITFGNLPLNHGLKDGDKVNLTFIHIDYKTNTLNTQTIAHSYDQNIMKDVRKNLAKFISTVASPTAKFNFSDPALQSLSSANVKLYRTKTVKQNTPIAINDRYLVELIAKLLSCKTQLSEITRILQYILENSDADINRWKNCSDTKVLNHLSNDHEQPTSVIEREDHELPSLANTHVEGFNTSINRRR